MNIKDIKMGDVLLFSPEKGSFISWAITFLTGEPVSHAAMYYSEEDQSIIEETSPQIKVNPPKSPRNTCINPTFLTPFIPSFTLRQKRNTVLSWIFGQKRFEELKDFQ